MRKESRMGLTEKLSASKEHMELWVRRYGIKGLSDRLTHSLALFLCRGCLGDCAVAACFFQWTVF